MPRRTNSSPQTLQLLAALADRPMEWRYGYDLSRETGLKSGTLYPQLMRLEESGWLEAKWEDPVQPGKPARHMYRLTKAGVEQARETIRVIDHNRLAPLAPKEASW